MLTIDGKQYRNLEEQVRKNKEDIQSIIDASAILNAFGIKVVGQVNTSDKLPNAADYPGEYGDAYLVGTATPYDYYIFTRPNDTHPTAYWLNIGEFPLAGEKGEIGPAGPRGEKGDGSKWYTGAQNPTIVAEVNDQYLNTTDGSVFSYSSVGWTRVGNIRGIQGVPGPKGDSIKGDRGEIGPAGPVGPVGDVGGIVNIRGLVDNVNQLPTPTSLQNLSIAYLVGTNKELYIQIGETPETATWNNMGILNVATYVTVNGQYVNVLEMNQYQNKIRFLQLTGTSGTLTSEQINLLRSDNTNYIIVDNELYNCNDLQDSNGYLVYTHTCADASGNVNIKTLSITLTNNNWSIQTTPVQPKIPVANTNEAVQFAEDERQKSKNLLNPQWLKQGAYVFTTGTFSYDANYVTTEKISVKPNSQIVMSANIGIDSDSGFVFFNDGVYVGYAGSGAVTATVPSNANQVVFNFHATGITPASLTTPQLEYGSVATDYQPYNGAIVHEKEIKPDLLYDKETKNIINGTPYTNGLNGVSGYPINVSKYKKLKIYAYLTGVAVIFDIDLINIYSIAYKGGAACLSNDLTDVSMINASVGPDKDYVAFNLGFWNANGVNLRNDNEGWFVYRIEGIR